MEKLLPPGLLDFCAGTSAAPAHPAVTQSVSSSSSSFATSAAVDPDAAAEPFHGLFDDDASASEADETESDEAQLLSSGPSFMAKAKKKAASALATGKKGINVVKKLNDHSSTLAQSSTAGKVLNGIGKVTSTADKLANAFPPAKAVTKPLNQAVSLAKTANQATKAYDIYKTGDAHPLLGTDETEESFTRESDYEDLVAAGTRSDD